MISNIVSTDGKYGRSDVFEREVEYTENVKLLIKSCQSEILVV